MNKIILLLIITLTLKLNAQEFKPPFALGWKQSPDAIIQWAEKRKHTITWIEDPNKKEKKLEVTHNQGQTFPNATFNKITFFFLNGQMLEVSIHYIKSNKSNKEINKFLKVPIIQITKTNGKGVLVIDKKLNGIHTKITQWEKGNNQFIRLSQAKSLTQFNKKTYARYTISYRNEN